MYNKIIKSVAILILLTFFVSCKKDKLEGEYAVFVGKWRWTKSNEYISNPSGSTISFDSVQSSNYSDIYELEFLAKGKVRLLKNNAVIEEYRTVMSIYRLYGDFGNWADTYEFHINLDNKNDHFMTGIVNSENMLLSYKLFPLENYKEGANEVTYTHYFVKQ